MIHKSAVERLHLGIYEVDLLWGLQQLAALQDELDLVAAGVPYEELGVKERRQQQMPCIISSTGRLIDDPAALNDSALTPEGSFAHLKLTGSMRSQEGLSTRSVGALMKDLQAAYSNDNIAGILIEVNTGGGESMAGSMLQAMIAESPKPVVAWAHMMASAGVRAMLPADEIIASSDGAQIGSIGTYITVDKDFARWYSRWYEDIYADKSSKKNKEHRSLMQGDLGPLKEMLNKHNEQFLAEVQKFRELKGDVEDTLSGEMFFAKTAKSRGLVDGIGSFNYALTRLATLAKRRKNAM